MKKTNLLVLSAAAALFATSCSKDQVSEANQGNAIRLKSFTGAATKATETTAADMTDFKVHAFTGTNPSFTAFFTDTYVNNGGGTSFSPEGGTHYWPADGTQNCVFMGYSPADLGNAIFDETDGAPVATVTDPTSSTIAGLKQVQHADGQVDLLVFRNHGTGNNNASGVNLYMQHAMSQIVVQAANYNPNITVKVKAVKIFVKGKGTLTLPTSSIMELNSPIPRSSWTVDNTYHSFVAGGKGGDTPTQEVTVSTTTTAPTNLMFSEGGFMLIPQQLEAWTSSNAADGAYIAVLCNITQGTTQLHPSTTPGGYGYAAVPINTAWDPGKKYTYTLQFFKDNGGGGVTPPIDPTDPVDPTPDPGNPGQPVVGGPISFTVQVNTWTDASGQPADTPMGGTGA